MFKSNLEQQVNSGSVSRQTYLQGLPKQLLPIVLMVYVPAVGAILALNIFTQLTGLPVSYFTADVAATTKQEFYVGIYSHIGIMLWCACTAICFFSYAALRKQSKNQKLSLFLLYSGIVTLLLLIDDLFLIHEAVFPKYFNVSEKRFYAGYGLILLSYFIWFRKTIFKTEFFFLALALGFFGVSVLIDLKFTQRYLFEDGAKLLGIVSWVTYFTRVCLSQVRANT